MLYSRMEPLTNLPAQNITLDLSPPDHRELAAFLTLAHPDRPVSAQDLQRLKAARLPSDPFLQVMARQAAPVTEASAGPSAGPNPNQILGWAEVSFPRMDSHPGWLAVGVRTQPDQARGLLPRRLLAWAEEHALALGAHTLVARVQEDWWEKPFLEAHGYAEHDRMWYSTLNLTTLDFDQFQPYEARAAASGITVRPLSELGDFEEAQQRRLYTLIAALLRDVPSTTPISVWPFETWQARFARTLEYPEGLLVALSPAGDWIGMTDLRVPISTRPGTLQTGLTGVLPQWRGHGVAYALKLTSARVGLARGFTQARTGNHSINRPMLSINEALGFVREAAWVTMVKHRDAAAQSRSVGNSS